MEFDVLFDIVSFLYNEVPRHLQLSTSRRVSRDPRCHENSEAVSQRIKNGYLLNLILHDGRQKMWRKCQQDSEFQRDDWGCCLALSEELLNRIEIYLQLKTVCILQSEPVLASNRFHISSSISCRFTAHSKSGYHSPFRYTSYILAILCAGTGNSSH